MQRAVGQWHSSLEAFRCEIPYRVRICTLESPHCEPCLSKLCQYRDIVICCVQNYPGTEYLEDDPAHKF